VKIISTKIPRTGSSSFGAVLATQYHTANGAELRFKIPGEGLHDAGHAWYTHRDAFLQGWRDVGPPELPGLEAIHAHRPIEMFKDMWPNAVRVCFMRHPVPQVISGYFFARQIGHISPHMSILEYISIQHRQNWQSMYMGGTLDNYHFVGISEYWAEEVLILGGLLGWKNLNSINLNVRLNIGREWTNEKKAELLTSPMIRTEILNANQADFALYMEALEQRTVNHTRSYPWIT
jgi:hypothetical protein